MDITFDVIKRIAPRSSSGGGIHIEFSFASLFTTITTTRSWTQFCTTLYSLLEESYNPWHEAIWSIKFLQLQQRRHTHLLTYNKASTRN